MIVRFFQWDQPKNVYCGIKDINAGDMVVVSHEWGIFVAQVLIPNKTIEEQEPSGTVSRKASAQDREIVLNNKQRQKDLLLQVKEKAREHKLPMKIVDLHLSLDGGSVVVAFLADGRIDFRTIVKDLSAKFQKTVRFQQIGSRDEARRVGGYGICGRELCCRKFPGSLKSISTDMAREQLISHRGSDRISGVCGRLMCCLSFEASQYQELLQGMPEKGQVVVLKNGGKRARVLEVSALKQKIRAELEDGTILEIDKKDIKS
jgi:cell fate regulator YaaT (PSP1 superfamily)